REAEYPIFAESTLAEGLKEGEAFPEGAVLIRNSGGHADVVADHAGTVMRLEGAEALERRDRWQAIWDELKAKESLSDKEKEKLADRIADERIWWVELRE